MRIGFIGVGNIGKPAATNLITGGNQLAVYDVNSQPLDELSKMGATVRRMPSEIPPLAEVIFLSLPNHIIVEEVMLGNNGVLSALKKGQIVVDMTTSLPTVTKKIGKKMKEIGAEMLDIGVGASPADVAAHNATFMVGGDREVFEKVKPLLEITAKNIFYVGPLGAGNTVKLINNLMAMTNTACMIEAMVFGAKAGVDPKILFEVVSNASGNSRQWQFKAPRIMQRNFKPFFALDLAYKDLSLITMFAQELKVPIFLASTAKQMFEMARAQGLGNEDNVALVKVLEKIACVKVEE